MGLALWARPEGKPGMGGQNAAGLDIAADGKIPWRDLDFLLCLVLI
jgi:hypothetical protein